MTANDDATTPTFDPLHGDTAEMRQQRTSYRLFKITFSGMINPVSSLIRETR